MRYWLLTSTFYGTWLPGDRRGFVGRVRESRPGDNPDARRREHDRIGDVYDQNIPPLALASHRLMKGKPIRVSEPQAVALVEQFQQSSNFRSWKLLTCAVMPDHVHWVVGLEASAHGRIGLQTLKAYGSRVLNQQWGRPPNGTWWTSKGSARRLPDTSAVIAACRYVAFRQPNPIQVLVADPLPEWMPPLESHGRLTSAAR